EGPKELGTDPESGQTVSLRKGPYGIYVQLGEAEGTGKEKTKPKRASLPKGMAPEDVTLDKALGLLALPREVGIHPESGKPIQAGIGRFGPYLKHDGAYKSLGRDEDVLTIGLNRAVTLLAEASPGRKSAAPLRELGEHPTEGGPVTINKGRFGPYVKHGKIMASLPRDRSPDELTMEEAVGLLAARAERAKGGKGKATAKVKGAAASKPVTGKSTAKKVPPKKAGAKKSAAAKSKAATSAKQAQPTPAVRKRSASGSGD